MMWGCFYTLEMAKVAIYIYSYKNVPFPEYKSSIMLDSDYAEQASLLAGKEMS